ncbi:MAG: hypothetical protein II979_06630, partial [Clostridia bacterium]|nr:hypothetical protein [Clostridia bacterium]
MVKEASGASMQMGASFFYAVLYWRTAVGWGLSFFENWDVCFAYSGGVFLKMFEGEFSFAFAYSGFVGTMTIVGVSFRTGLRGQGRG